ncbi:MAG: hypothetical protein K8S21_12675 [Gemmatimonadetes bacterium]|nr:hypothetical protein [Gemmatimonadota bacterium]
MAVPISHPFAGPDCTGWHQTLDALVDGEAGSLCSARAEAHAAECPACARRLAAAHAYKRALRRAGDAERAPIELRESVMASLRGVRRSRTP